LTVAFERICIRTLPDGSVRKVYPYHVSLEGMAQLVLCRDDEDYDVMVKYIFICARRKNVIVVIYIAMSNHGHATILAASQEDADDFTVEWLRMYSQYFSKKYRQRKVLRHTSAVAIYLDSDWYLRNTLAYVPKNALDAQSRVEDYRWSGYRGMFCQGKAPGGFRKAATLKRREKEACFHTHDSLDGLPWIINADGELEPASVCDHAYLEAAFGNDQAFFLKTIGTVSMAEMQQKLVDNPRQRQNDTEMLKTIESISQGWFRCSLLDLPLEKKVRLLPYVYRAYRTSVAQLARCFGMAPDEVARKVGKHPSK
jgi:REP element-mobilizing transposase RayT